MYIITDKHGVATHPDVYKISLESDDWNFPSNACLDTLTELVFEASGQVKEYEFVAVGPPFWSRARKTYKQPIIIKIRVPNLQVFKILRDTFEDYGENYECVFK